MEIYYSVELLFQEFILSPSGWIFTLQFYYLRNLEELKFLTVIDGTLKITYNSSSFLTFSGGWMVDPREEEDNNSIHYLPCRICRSILGHFNLWFPPESRLKLPKDQSEVLEYDSFYQLIVWHITKLLLFKMSKEVPSSIFPLALDQKGKRIRFFLQNFY